MPDEWRGGITVPVHNKMVRDNHKGIILLAAYKIYTTVIYARLQGYSKSLPGEYQQVFTVTISFRKGMGVSEKEHTSIHEF